MVQPKTPPLSIRLAPDLVAELEAHMAATGRSRNLAISQLLRLGLQAFADTPKYMAKPGSAPEALAKMAAKPWEPLVINRIAAASKPFRPHPKPGKAKR